MKKVIILDLDGVLITTPPWKPDTIHTDGYSDFNQDCVVEFNRLLTEFDAEIWLSSSRRSNKTVAEFNTIFANRGITRKISGYVPDGAQGSSRLVQLNAFWDHEPILHFLILDDDTTLNGLAENRKLCWIQTLPLIGFRESHRIEALERMKLWI
jgi:hypothetical protein